MGLNLFSFIFLYCRLAVTTMDKYSSAQENVQCYTSREIILMAFLWLLIGALLTASLFVLYLKRTHQLQQCVTTKMPLYFPTGTKAAIQKPGHIVHSTVKAEVRCIVTTMDKCFIFTTLLLVYLVAVLDSRVLYQCEIDEENNGDSKENLDFRLEFTRDTISNITSKQHYFCNVITKESGNIIQCYERKISYPISCSGDPSSWSSWSECITSGEGYKHRSLKCHSNQSECLVPSNGSSFEISTCIPASSTTEKENGKEVEKRYTLTEIILVALCCLLMGVIITILVFVLYMKRTQRGCFSKDIKDVQGDSKQQSGPDMQFLTENVVVKKNEPNNPKSVDSKNENKVEETQYQSLNSNQIGNDQQTYDQINVNEPRSHRQGHQSSSSRLQQTANDYQIDQITKLQHKNEGVYEYCRDSDIDGHNYFVLERENMSRESRARNLGRPETHAEVGDEVKDSTLGTEEKQSDAAHKYFLLKHFENGHNQD